MVVRGHPLEPRGEGKKEVVWVGKLRLIGNYSTWVHLEMAEVVLGVSEGP